MGEQRLFEGVVEAMLAVERLCEEVGLWDIALLAEYHVNCASGV